MGEFITIVYANVQMEVRKHQTEVGEVWYNEAKNAKDAVIRDVYRSYDQDEHILARHRADVRLQFTYDLCQKNRKWPIEISGKNLCFSSAACSLCHDFDCNICLRRGKNGTVNVTHPLREP